MQQFKVLQRPGRLVASDKSQGAAERLGASPGRKPTSAALPRFHAASTRKARAAQQVRSQVDSLVGSPKLDIHGAQFMSAWRRDVLAARYFCGALIGPEGRIAPCDSSFAENGMGGIASRTPGCGRQGARQPRPGPDSDFPPWVSPASAWGGKQRSGQDFYYSHVISRLRSGSTRSRPVHGCFSNQGREAERRRSFV